MHYLKCGHCGMHSALKSEYVTFCDHCSKKLPDTFAGWKTRNPNGTFEAFMEEAGIPEQQYLAAIRKSQNWIFNLRQKAVLITVIVVLAACGTLGAWYGPGLMKIFSKPGASVTLLETGNWRTFRGNVLRLQTPFSLSPVSQEDKPNIRFKTFNGGRWADGLEISMREAIFLSEAHLDLQPASKELADAFATQSGVSQFSYNEKMMQLNGSPAVWQQGSYVQDHSSAMEFCSLVLVKGGIRVQVLVTHQGNDSTARRVAEAVLRSAQLN